MKNNENKWESVKGKSGWVMKSAVAVIGFLVTDTIFTEVFALCLMRLNMPEQYLKICYEVGNCFVTILLAFPVFVLILRCFGPLKKFSFREKRGLSAKRGVLYAALLLFPAVCIPLGEIVLIKNGIVNVADIVDFTLINILYTVVFNCFLMPVTEEIMFRGILLHKLLPFGKNYAVLTTTLFFALIHYNNPVNMLLALILGAVFARIAVETEGILNTVLCHMGINLLEQVIFPLLIFIRYQ